MLEACFRRHPLRIGAPTCGCCLALEHSRDVYTFDHFAGPAYKPGRLHDTPLADLVALHQTRRFGMDKQDRLTGQCRTCPVRQLCDGGCAKDRFMPSKAGEADHNYLCEGLEPFYTHTRPTGMAVAHLIRNGRSPTEIVALVRAEDAGQSKSTPCACGSGRKHLACQGSTGVGVGPTARADAYPGV
jgi:uncharacterized protein